jgi:arabinogalactan oligomer/maltooligosaccharide transport system permease protein
MSTASRATTRSTTTRSTNDAQSLAPRRRSFGAWFADTGWRHLVAIVVSAFALFPLLYVVSASLNPKGTLTGSNQLFSAIGIDI